MTSPRKSVMTPFGKIVCSLVAALVPAGAATAADWPQFHGHKLLWTARGLGHGFSSLSIEDGYIVAEAYFGKFRQDSLHVSHSMAKSFTIGLKWHEDWSKWDPATNDALKMGASRRFVKYMSERVGLHDPATDSWTSGPKLPRPHSHAENSTFVHKGRIFVIGGRSVNRVEAAIWVLSPAGKWSQYGKLPRPLIGPAARIIDGRLVVAGGAPRGYDPQSAVWAQTLGP